MVYIILIFAWVIFYCLHTALASLNIKRKIKEVMGKGYKWYRLVYTVFATLFFLGIFLYSATLDPYFILNPTGLLTYLGYVLATFGVIVSVKAFKKMNTSQFIGLNAKDDLVESTPFVSEGLYSHMRHPLYLGLLLIFLGYFFFQPNLAALIHLLALLIYLPFGIKYEEQKLLEIYPNDYPNYQKNVPPLFPTFHKK